jgi:Protein of unknown function (DUF2281)
MTIAEQIYTLVKSLPQDQASEVLTFVEALRVKHSDTKQSGSTVEEQPWAEFVYSLAGAWQDDFPSLEEIRANSGQDILRESL